MRRLRYGWEQKNEKRFDRVLDHLISEARKLLPEGYDLAGISIVHVEEVEACYISSFPPSNDIWEKDVMKDIWVDAQRQYDECFKPRAKA